MILQRATWYDGNMKRTSDVLIEDGIIRSVDYDGPTNGHDLIDASGKLLIPGLVDVHVHLREPGGEKKETIKTGTEAAAAGGFTTICAMPNTRPVPDDRATMDDLLTKIEQDAVVRVLPYAAITKRQLGTEQVDMASLADAFAFTDDGVGVQAAAMMREAMREAKRLGKAVVAHCEDNTLKAGSVHEGRFSEEHGIQGIPSLAESIHIARDVLIAEETGCHYHVCHVSSRQSVRVIRDAKRAGIHVTAEVTPHHLVLCEDDIPGLDSNFKMNPPLRSADDREALLEGLRDGTIDMIATDHAPHTAEEKAEGMERAPFGITGFETAFPLLYTTFVKTGQMEEAALIEWMTKRPSDVFGLPYGIIGVGRAADLVLVDTNTVRQVDPATFRSKGKNTPFARKELTGWPVMTIAAGEIVYKGRFDETNIMA
ncbi:dihydroorotase [Exiguobacterium aurantiacum]|uniref:Dihydroorotase n=1 Tax=Exiguobacterium aurantiacum TaxID=33987 RepID=A0A377FUP2_9BACL|nr:dihydroorotase [Exiguobacterium aurantiacum]STO08530.1 Dihydroorotase [Exiguobacterium aurantiacum]